MENTAEKIETEGFYAREYGLNVDVPKGMTDVDFKDYTYNLNRGMTQEDRIKYYKKPISWEEGQLIAKRSKDNPEEKSLLSEVWEGAKNSFKVGWNQGADLLTSFGEATDIGVSSLVLSAMPDQEKARQTLLNQIEAYNEVKDKIKLDTSTAGEVSSGFGSVGLSTFAGAATYANPVANGMFLTSFGLSSYLSNLETMLKEGASIKEANTKALLGGVLEVASEKAGLKIAGKYTNTLLKKYGARFGIEGIQELWQDTKDEVILGKYDTRTEEEKAKSSAYAFLFGGIGGAIGFALADVSSRDTRKDIKDKASKQGYTQSEAEQIGLSVLDEDGAEQRKEIQAKAIERAKEQITATRSQLYDKFIEKGDSAEIAAEKAQMLVPDYELMKKDVESLVKEGFSEEEKENLKQSYLEAVNSAGEEAGLYLAANEEIRNLIQNAGRSEQEAKDYAAYMTGLMIKDYQILKDTGFEGTFEDVKEKFYKLNKITDYAFEDESEAWAEYDRRNRQLTNEEKEFFEEKPSHKLYSVKEEGTDFTEFKGNPEGAIEKLLSEKSGYVSEAIYKEGVGNIDFIYGKTGKKGYGLAHIVERRNASGIDGEEFVKTIPEIIRNGEVYNQINQKGRTFIVTKDREVIIRLDWDGKRRNWLLTAYMKTSGASPLGLTSGGNYLDEQTTSSNSAMADNITPLNENVNGKLYSKTQGEVVGSYDELTREVELFKGQNPSTLMHELSHHFLLNHLNLMESMGLKDRNSEVFKFLSEVGGHEINSVNDMTDVDKENLTEAFINYMNTNEAPNLATKSIFQRAKEWVIDQYRIHQTDASPEIREYFDGLISRESAMPDVSSMVNRTAEIREILKQAINGEQVSFKGLGKKELEQLQKALHTRIRRKGKSLRDELIEAGGIKEGTELAKALGFDVLKKDKMYSTKDTAIETEQELIDWLTEKGYIVGVQEGESYSDTERRWEEVLSLIDNAENTYTVKESMINNERETAIRNQAHAQGIVDELLKDNALGLKDIHDLDNLLTRTISKKDDVDIIKVNTNAVKYLNERMRSLTKDTKELLRNKDKEFKSKREEQYQAQNDLKDFIRNLPINGKHKVSLMGNIQRVKDYDSLQKVVNEIKPRVQGFIEQEIKTLLSNKIDAIVRSSKPKERKKQKFNYEYNTFFEELREINKLTKEQAQDKLKEIFEMLGEDVEFDGTDLLKNMFLTYKSNGMNSSVELMKQLSDELDNIYNEALQDRMDTLERLGQEREAKIKEAVDYIENTKAVNKLNQKLLKITNLNSNLSELFGKKWADKHKMDSLLIKQDMETNKALDDVIREGKDIYGLKNREEFVKLANDMRVTKEEYTLNNYRDDMSEQISKMQIMDIYLTIKNKGSAEAYRRLYEDFDELGNQTTTQIEDLLSYLTEEDKKFADMLQKRVNDLYKAENKVYVKLYGIDMPKHENYWMRTSDRAERPLMDIKQFMNVDMLPSFMKERSKAPSVRPDDVFKKFARRIHDSKYMTEVFEQYKDIYDLVHSNRVKKAIVKKYDNDRYKVLNQSLKRISLGGVNDSYNELNNMLGKAITNWVVSKISISESVFVKQILSFTNYMENIPVSDFLKYQAEFWANPKEAVGFMKNFAGEYLDHRFKSGIQNEVLQRIMQSKPEEYSKATGAYQKYLNFVTAPVRGGDIGAIYLGGYARARYLLEQGIPLEQARKMFIEETESAQQSGNKAELSEFQHNALWRVFTAFKNTNLQYMRKMQDSYIQFTRGEISAQQFGKTWGNYMVIQSVLYQVATNFFTWLRDDDDEEINVMKDVWMRILTAPVAGFPIIGDITEGVFAENYWGLNISGKQDMEAFIGAARDAIDGEYDAKKIAKGSMSLISFFRPIPDRMIKAVINLVED